MGTEPIVARTSVELERALADARRSGKRVGVVMTMGALHSGHATLLRRAREECEVTVATIFVNPLQFGPAEDFDRYPRTLDSDLAICAAEQVDVVFAPGVEELYRDGQPMVRLSAGAMGELLEGASRPGFFDGVLTVVAALLHLVRPQLTYFGEKDAQQLAMVRRMVHDLHFPTEVIGVPTAREEDGLALSSRNVYLTDAERTSALQLHRALSAGRQQVGGGPDAVRSAAAAVLGEAALLDPPVELDYLALVDPATFAEVRPGYRGPAVLAVAAKVGRTRLIDNLPLAFAAAPDEASHPVPATEYVAQSE